MVMKARSRVKNTGYMPDYSQFTTDDFIRDDAFLAWVRHPAPDTDRVWQTFLTNHPDRRANLEAARQFVLAIRFDEQLTPTEQRQLWQTIRQATDQPTRSLPALPEPGRGWRLGTRQWTRVAAVLTAGLLLGAGSYVYLSRQSTVVATEYSQLRQLTLPDGSAITLNAHSTLRYGTDFARPGQTREVWLDGEAFFRVRHTATHQKFIVHTPDVTVEVLGTEFDLSRRNGTTKVVLASGRVKVSANEGAARRQLIMKPGDLVEFSDRSQRLTRRPVDVAAYSAWTRRKFVFDDTPVTEIISLLRDNYGYTVAVADTTILTETLSGEIQADSEVNLLRALSKALALQITKTDKTLTISRLL
jgi:transmembrane sensor